MFPAEVSSRSACMTQKKTKLSVSLNQRDVRYTVNTKKLIDFSFDPFVFQFPVNLSFTWCAVIIAFSEASMGAAQIFHMPCYIC